MSVWKTLSAIDVNEWVEKKGQFSYLAWTQAWAAVKREYPTANYHLEDDLIYPDSTMEVRVTVTIEEISHTMFLPVLDFKNKAICNPNAFDINSSRMRCLVKCLAMFGLGHYIYAGESAPQEPPRETFTAEQKAEYIAICAANDGWRMKKFGKTVGNDVMTALFNAAPQGEKTRQKKHVNDMVTDANGQLKRSIAALQNMVDVGDPSDTVTEALNELEDIEHEFVLAGLGEVLTQQLTELVGDLKR